MPSSRRGRSALLSLLLAHAAAGLFILFAAGCGNSGNDPNNLTPAQQQNIEDELKSQEEVKDQPPI